MKIIFMGTPEFAAAALRALSDAGHSIVCVYTQPPRAAGRGQKARPGPVHALAESLGLPVRHPASLKSAEEQAAFAALDADVAVVAAYGLILPQAILDAPRLGCINIHASLLPRWRGAAPIQRAIEAGDAATGISIMQMDAGLDTGPVLAREAIPITEATDAGTLHDELAALGARLIVDVLARLEAGPLHAEAQPEAGVTYAAKIDKAEARLDWQRPAVQLARQVRAFNPYPGAWFGYNGERTKVLTAIPVAGGHANAAPGTVLDDALTVACGGGTMLRIGTVQRAGKKPMEAREMLRGFPIPAGARLESGT